MPQWLWALIVGTVLLGLVGVIYALLLERLRNVEAWIRDHGAPLPSELQDVEVNVGGLRLWKHTTVDPYIPRAVDELDRRVGRLEDKVFP
jgi:hypothetical protein